jgi:hypothetical protein
MRMAALGSLCAGAAAAAGAWSGAPGLVVGLSLAVAGLFTSVLLLHVAAFVRHAVSREHQTIARDDAGRRMVTARVARAGLAGALVGVVTFALLGRSRDAEAQLRCEGLHTPNLDYSEDHCAPNEQAAKAMSINGIRAAAKAYCRQFSTYLCPECKQARTLTFTEPECVAVGQCRRNNQHTQYRCTSVIQRVNCHC